MTPHRIREVRLTHDGSEPLTPESFELDTRDLPALPADHLLVRVSYASLDPSHRIALKRGAPGTVPPAGIVGEVLVSNSDRYVPGDQVTGRGTWSDLVVLDASAATRYEPQDGLAGHHAVGLLGLTGLTGYFGVTKVVRPRAGERLVVSGAFGGVGQVACQVAAVEGADVLGLVGSEDKVRGLRRLGVAALNHRDPGWVAALEEWAPDGVDLFFDNVWGPAAGVVVEHLKPLGRIALCGQMSSLGEAVPPLPIDDWFRFVTRSLTLQGFRAADYAAENARAQAELANLIRAGRLRQEVHLVKGWENAAEGFCDMLAGRTVGKLVVEVPA